MKRAVLLLPVVLLLACGGGAEQHASTKPVSEPGEKLYTVRGVILARDADDNTVNMDHEAIPGFMEAMIMDYTVRGVKVTTLPPDQSRVEAKLHVTKSGYWITDVKRIP